MKYKLLLVGRNKGLINDFFMQMDTFFDCLTSSIRFADLLGHVKYMQPHAVVFCMNAENRDDTIAISILHNHLETLKIPLVLICDSDDYSLFFKLSATKEELLIMKPFSLLTVQEKLLSYLNKYAPKDKQPYALADSNTTNSENTLLLLSQLEKALASSDDTSINEPQNLPESPTPEDSTPEDSTADDSTTDDSVPNDSAPDESAPNELTKEDSTADTPKRIMIIDDSPGMLKAIKEQLGTNYEVATAISGKIALKYLQNKTVDLIFLDYAMPNEDGPAVYEKILANPQTANIPVIFLTGVSDSSMIQKALSLKPKGYILKPVDKETLLTKVHEILG